MKRKSSLPIVTPETMWNIDHRLSYQTDNECLRKELRAIKKENPLVARFISLWVNDKDIPKKFRKYSVFCAIIVYRMLASQAEANELNEQLGA